MSFIKVLILCLFVLPVKGQVSLDQQILDLLQVQNELLDEISYTVVQEDFARIRLIKKAIKKIQDNITENKEAEIAPLTWQTYNYMQRLMIQYRHSKKFFGWEEEPSYLSIHTPLTAEAIEKLNQSYLTTIKVYGFQVDPTLTITFDTFMQIEKSLRSLIGFTKDETIKEQLKDIIPVIGKTISISKVEGGDNLCTFHQARKAIREIRTIYELFYQMNNDAVAFELILEVQGQTEFYVEYSGMDRLEGEDQSCQ